MIVKNANSNLANNPLSPFIKPGLTTNKEEKELRDVIIWVANPTPPHAYPTPSTPLARKAVILLCKRYNSQSRSYTK